MHLQQFGWDGFFAQHLPEGARAGRVCSVNHEQFFVWTCDVELRCTISGRLRDSSLDWPVVGDWVALRSDAPVIESVLPRWTKISRKQPGRTTREQVLAANIDVLLIVTALGRDYNPRRLERYLALAKESGARPAIVLNKADLAEELNVDLSSVVRETEQLGGSARVLAVSAQSGEGLDDIVDLAAAGETAALIGSSGVGKSTILNRLLGADRQRTSPVRQDDDRGRHTTTSRELFVLPQGLLLIDMPGLRELHLWTDPEQLDSSFAEIHRLAEHCRFRDCTHRTEPGCAVLNATFDPGRVANYQKLQRELEYLKRQDDPESEREHKRKVKQMIRAQEKLQRRRPKF